MMDNSAARGSSAAALYLHAAAGPRPPARLLYVHRLSGPERQKLSETLKGAELIMTQVSTAMVCVCVCVRVHMQTIRFTHVCCTISSSNAHTDMLGWNEHVSCLPASCISVWPVYRLLLVSAVTESLCDFY